MKLLLVRSDKCVEENHENAFGLEIYHPDGSDNRCWWYVTIVPPGRDYLFPVAFVDSIRTVLSCVYGKRCWTPELGRELSDKASEALGVRTRVEFDANTNRAVFFITEEKNGYEREVDSASS